MMGIFKDYRTLSKQTREMSAHHDVGGSLATMQAKMEALNNSMSKAANGRAMVQGAACRASVLLAHPTGASVNGHDWYSRRQSWRPLPLARWAALR